MKKKKSGWTPPTKATFIISLLFWLYALSVLFMFPPTTTIVFAGYLTSVSAWLLLAIGILYEKI